MVLWEVLRLRKSEDLFLDFWVVRVLEFRAKLSLSLGFL